VTPPEQEQMCLWLREKHPRWTLRFCSGWVHGAQDETFRRIPCPGYVSGMMKDDYDRGYVLGFMVHRGPDVESMPCFGGIGKCSPRN